MFHQVLGQVLFLGFPSGALESDHDVHFRGVRDARLVCTEHADDVRSDARGPVCSPA